MTFVNKFPKSFPFDNLMLFKLSNGDKEIRTPDPLLARQVLSQLSYTPIFNSHKINDYSNEIWWAEVDSNHRPHAYQACALTC